jgi:hypothetical protein
MSLASIATLRPYFRKLSVQAGGHAVDAGGEQVAVVGGHARHSISRRSPDAF